MSKEMFVDPNKVNLAEKDIEDWLWENPGVLEIEGMKWLGRQVTVPSGVIDLLGYCHDPDCDCLRPIIIELKNTEFTQAAILQVCRYAADIDVAIESLSEWNHTAKLLIAKGTPSNQLMYEADAVEVSLCSFKVNYAISVSNKWGWKDEDIKRDAEKNKQLGIDMFLKVPQSAQKSEVPLDLIENMRKIDAQLSDDSD